MRRSRRTEVPPRPAAGRRQPGRSAARAAVGRRPWAVAEASSAPSRAALRRVCTIGARMRTYVRMTHSRYLRNMARLLRVEQQLTVDELAGRLTLSRSTV